MAGAKQQKVMHDREASPWDTLDMKSLDHFKKSCRDTTGRKLCFVLFTEIFPPAVKVSKLQKLLSAKRWCPREIDCVYPAEACLVVWVLWQAGQRAQCTAGYISETWWSDRQGCNPAPLSGTAVMEQSQCNHEKVKSAWEEGQASQQMDTENQHGSQWSSLQATRKVS